MTKKADIESIEKATGKKWTDWLKFFDKIGADKLTHTEIAHKVHEQLDIESAGWWSQGVAVAYEQHIGRRVPGQRSDGTFEISVTKVLDGSKDDCFAKLLEMVDSYAEFDKYEISDTRTSVTPIRSYWKCNLDDNSKVTMAISLRSSDKAMISIGHGNLSTAKKAEDYRSFWKKFLKGVS